MSAHVSDVLNRQLVAFEFKADSIALSLKHHFLSKFLVLSFILSLPAAADCMAASKDAFENGYKRPAVAAHDDNSLVLSSDGAVYVAGRSTFELGLGGASVSDAKRGTFLKIPSLSGKNIAAVSAGLNHLLALDGKGKVYAAGRNAYGQLGLGGTGDRNTFAEVSALNCCYSGWARSLSGDRRRRQGLRCWI